MGTRCLACNHYLQIWGIAEIADYLERSKPNTCRLIRRSYRKPDGQFPQPAEYLASGRLWHAEEVKTWINEYL